MESFSSLSDYSEDFEEEYLSKGGSSKPTLPTEVITDTPKRLSARAPPGPVVTRTDPGQRKIRSHYNPSTVRNNFRHGKGRIMSERLDTKKKGLSPRDRELSAKVHSIKKLQNQLADCQRKLIDAKKENKLLTRLQVRQERELNRVTTQEGELPQILARHSEEMRVMREQLKRSHELSSTQQDKVTTLYAEIQRLKNRGKKLEQVAKQRNLLERESLTLQLQKANEQIHQKDKKLKDLEKGIEMLNKTHGHEIRTLMVKNKALSQDLEASNERADKLFSHLKERTKEMDVMNIYSQRIGRNTLNNSTLPQLDLAEDKFSQTDLSCPPNKNILLQTKKTIQSSSSQTLISPKPVCEPRATQTDPVAPPPAQKPQSPPATVDPPQLPVVTSPSKKQDALESPYLLQKQQQTVTLNEEETQRKNILLSKLRQLDSKTEPPASQTITTVSQSTATEKTVIKPPENVTMDQPIAGKLKNDNKPPPGPSIQEKEAEKKKLLLAKLLAIDKNNDPKTVTTETNVKPVRTQSGQSSSSSIQSWQADTTDNLHKGKPAFFTEDDPFGKQKLSAKRSSGLLVKSDPKLPNSSSNPGYKPAFGRRARGVEVGPSTTSHKTTPTNSIFGDHKKPAKSILNEGRKDSFGVLETESFNGSRDYPWEKRVNIKESSLHNQSMVFGPTSSSSLLPLRPKADANRVDMIPGAMAEPDDIEEIVL